MIVELLEPAAARDWCDELRARGRTQGFVPTMGALHAGHLALVRRARRENDEVCVSVFVNPLQFNDPQDYARYPRDFAGDARLLDGAGAAMVFTGTLASFFPGETTGAGTLRPEALRQPGPSARGLEGELRPGHFAGVATIVARLFEITRPTRAYFGQKDFQQTLVVRELAAELGYPELVVCPTEREASGLARSSRNERLAPADRERARVLYQSLCAADELWKRGERRARALRERMLAVLAGLPAGAPLEVEYATVRDPLAWTSDEPSQPLARGVALLAARIGGVRLIDNLILGEAPQA